MKPKHERRIHGSPPRLERRVGEDGETTTPTIVGYAAVFGEVADIGGYFREQVVAGAFARALEEGQDVRALWNHEPSDLLGRSVAGTLRLAEDERGLKVEIDIPDTQLGRDVVTLVERGDVSGMSFGFIAQLEKWEDDLRVLHDVDLFDVSLATYPAYEGTEVGLRSAAAAVVEARKRRLSSAQAQRRMRLRLSEIA